MYTYNDLSRSQSRVRRTIVASVRLSDTDYDFVMGIANQSAWRPGSFLRREFHKFMQGRHETKVPQYNLAEADTEADTRAVSKPSKVISFRYDPKWEQYEVIDRHFLRAWLFGLVNEMTRQGLGGKAASAYEYAKLMPGMLETPRSPRQSSARYPAI